MRLSGGEGEGDGGWERWWEGRMTVGGGGLRYEGKGGRGGLGRD